MKPEAFVKAFHIEKQQFLKEYLSDSSKSDAGQLIKSLHLDAQQTDILKKILSLRILISRYESKAEYFFFQTIQKIPSTLPFP